MKGHKTAIAHKVIHRDERKCSYDKNLDCIDYHPYPKGTQSTDKASMVSVKSDGNYQAQPFCQGRYAHMD